MSNHQVVAPAGYEVSDLIVVAATDDPRVRRDVESGFSDRMTELGVPSDQSFLIMEDLSDLADPARMEAAKARTQAGTSVLIEIVDQNEDAEVAADVLFATYLVGLALDNRDVRRAAAWGGLAATDAANRYKLRVTLWDMGDNSLLWSADTDSYMGGQSGVEANRLADFVHGVLIEDGLIPPEGD